VAEGNDEAAAIPLTLSTDVAPDFGTAVIVWTLADLPVSGDYLIDAAVTFVPTTLSVVASVRCFWSTRPDRFFSASVTPVLVAEDVSVHTVTLAVPGSIASPDTAAGLACQATGIAAETDVIEVTSIQVNAHHVTLARNT
jgi:hypothetical protein